MRIVAALVIALVASASSQTSTQVVNSPQGGLTGRWQAESTPPGTTWTAVLRVDGPRVVGAISSCGVEISEGTITGNRLTFKCSLGPRTTMFTGTISDDEIAFSWEMQNPADYFPIPATDRMF